MGHIEMNDNGDEKMTVATWEDKLVKIKSCNIRHSQLIDTPYLFEQIGHLNLIETSYLCEQLDQRVQNCQVITRQNFGQKKMSWKVILTYLRW